MEISAFLTVHIGIGFKPMGLRKFPFGGALVTSVGMMGIENTFACFPPFTRVPLLFVVCTTEKKAVVENDKIVIAPVLGLNVTLDHRYIDGARAAKFQAIVKDVISNPKKYSSLK